ncbi:translocation/assembly module TamB domain-containing protein [Leadbettera azotonutricia]|uniref:translocation/assembly module TamB domain-containing protein n=1 Tax=Leadbettera azotonutricia TaxID=150829 RepID=UPI00145D94E8|nr:translocation/assembly module TamB domain-containing protein [Leadbettera azotonutricia]
MELKFGGGSWKANTLIRTGVFFLSFSAMVVLTSLVLRPIQSTMIAAMEGLRDGLITRVEVFTGRTLVYGSLGPSIFGTLDLRDVKILRDDGTSILSVSRLRLSYSLLNLLQGKISEAFNSVRVDRPILTLDFEKDQDLKRLFAQPSQDERPANFSSLLPENFQIRLRNGESEFMSSPGTDSVPWNFKLQNLGLDVSLRKGRIVFQGKWNARGELNMGAPSPSLNAAMNARVNGEYSWVDGEGRGNFVIPSLAGNSFRLKPLSVSIVFRDQKFEVRKIYDKSPMDLAFTYDLEEEKLAAFFGCENFSLQDLVTLTGAWKDYNSWALLRLSGKASLEKTGAQGPPVYDFDLSGLIPARSPIGAASVAIKGNGDEKAVSIEELAVNSSRGNIRFDGKLDYNPLTPTGNLVVSELGLAGTEAPHEKLNAAFSIYSSGQKISFFGENLSAGNLTLSGLDGSVIHEKDGLTFALSAMRFKELDSYGDVRLSSFSLDGSVDYDPRHIQASLRLDSFSVRDILELLKPLGTTLPIISLSAVDDLSVTTEIFFTTDYEHMLYNAPRFVAAYEGPRDILAITSLSGTDRRFELEEGRISWGGGEAELSAFADFSNPDDISFSLQTNHKDLIYFLEGSVLDRRSLSIRGSYGFQAYLSAAGMGSYSGYVQGENIPIPSGDQNALLSFMASLRYDSLDLWSADLDRFEISDIAAPGSSYASLRLSGLADQDGARISNLLYDDGRGALSGILSLDWDKGYQNLRLLATVFDTQGKEHYDLSASYNDKTLGLFLKGEGMQLARIAQNAYGAVAAGNASLSWRTGSEFEAQVDLDSLVFRLNDTDVRVEASASLNPNVFFLDKFTLNYSGLEGTMPYFRVDRRASLAEVRAELHGALAGRGLDISLRGQAEFQPLASWFNIEDALDSISGSIAMDTARYDTFEADEPFSFAFSSVRNEAGPQIAVSGGPRNMIRFRYSSVPGSRGGDFYAALSSPSPVRGAFIGNISAGEIDAQVSDLYVDMGTLWGFIPPDFVVAFPGGIVTGAIHIAGPLSDPEFYGSARATSLKILVPQFIAAPIRPVPVAIALNGNEMSFGPVDAAVGNGSGLVSAWFRFDRWIPNIFNMDIVVPQEKAIPFGLDISGILAHGLAAGHLNLDMQDMIFTVSGDLTAQNTEISLNGDELAAMETASLQPHTSSISTLIDITIKTGRRVEFFWPSADFPVLQAYTDMGTGIHITSDAVSRRFTLQGDVKLRSGEIFYLERNFYLREGTLFFNESELQFDPRISARAEIRDQGEEGPVTISMLIDYAPLKSFTPRFESNPPLSQLEIFSMLGQNPQGASDQTNQRNILISASADALTQFAVTRRFQRVVRNFLGLDMFSVRTQVLQNMVFQAAGFNNGSNTPSTGSGTGTTGEETMPGERRAGNYFDNTTVFLGKYIGSDIFVQSLFSWRYDETKQTWGGIRFEPEIGLEMKNPLFNIQLNILPLHPENWFIDDVSFTFTWRRSF